jgi:hypothetical protein
MFCAKILDIPDIPIVAITPASIPNMIFLDLFLLMSFVDIILNNINIF